MNPCMAFVLLRMTQKTVAGFDNIDRYFKAFDRISHSDSPNATSDLSYSTST